MPTIKDGLKKVIPATYSSTQRHFTDTLQKLDELQTIDDHIQKTLVSFSAELHDQSNENTQKLEDMQRTTKWISKELSKLKHDVYVNRRSTLTNQASLFRKSMIEHLDYHLADHCNLNCASCSTFSPIAPPRLAKPEEFKEDIAQLHSIVGDRLIRLHLLGGEPLLHPEIEFFISTARDIFPYARIDVTTNGILTTKMSDSFWETLRTSRVDLKLTRYPIQIDYDAIIALAHDKGVFAFSAGDEPIRCFRRIPLNPRGTSSIYTTYLQCPYNNCPQLRNGKLFRCPASGMSDILNTAMESEGIRAYRFELSSLDYLDIHQSPSLEEVMDFLSDPIPFCQYCEMNKATDIPWEKSKKSVSEWVDIN